MAESLADKLKRIAREKAAAKAAAEVVAVVAVAEVANDQPVVAVVVEDTNGKSELVVDSGSDAGVGSVDLAPESETSSGEQDSRQAVASSTGLGNSIAADVDCIDSNSTLPNQPSPSTHPLAMQFAELEQALDSTDPAFKTKLRDIHRHLGQDPDLVTQMTEAEIALVVKGLVIFANAEIVEPAKAKTVKAATAAAKKKVISADDL